MVPYDSLIEEDHFGVPHLESDLFSALSIFALY